MDNITGDKSVDDMDIPALREVVRELDNRNEQLEESMYSLTLAIDDIGWKPLGFDQPEQEMPLETIKKFSETARALASINPQVKRGINVRGSYIWGEGVHVGDNTDSWYNKSIHQTIGSPSAQMQLERTGATDGNWFFLVDRTRRTVQRIPIWQISGWVTDVDDGEKVMYYKRTYTRRTADLSRVTAQAVEDQSRQVWYPSDELEGVPVQQIGGDPVEQDKVIVHTKFNSQVGWVFGIPDCLSVIFWSKAYKEYLENCATLAKAYARFAWKVTSNTKKGQQRAATRLAEAPYRDPQTGEYRDVGGAATLGAGQDLQALQTIRPVDFGAGQPLASMVAAGLEITTPMLTSDPGSGNRATAETLDEPTRLLMEARQEIARDTIQRILDVLGVRDRVIEMPELGGEPLHRQIQAVDQAGRSGMLYPAEWRKLILDAFDMGGVEEAPSEEDLPLAIKNEMEPTAQPDPPSRGDHEMRDNGEQSHTENGE